MTVIRCSLTVGTGQAQAEVCFASASAFAAKYVLGAAALTFSSVSAANAGRGMLCARQCEIAECGEKCGEREQVR